MTEIQLAIKNFAAQDEVFNSPARYKIVPKGRRFGLTKGAANDFIKSALGGTFKKGLWVDTVHANIDRYVERYFLPHLKKLPENYWSWRQQAKILKIGNAYIDFRSAQHPESIEGFGYDKAFINEAGIVLRDEYLWNNAIRPMLWDYQCPIVIGGTPKGKNVFYELAQRAKEPDQDRYKLFRFSTFDNPYLNKADIEEEIKDMNQDSVRQEIYAEFLDDTGLVFRNVNQVATATSKEPERGHTYVMGVDLAKVQDYTVISVYDRSNNSQVQQLRFNKLDWTFQKQRIIETSKYYNNALTMLDATGLGDPIADDLARAGVPIEPIKLTNETKKQIIEKAVLWFDTRKCQILNIEESIDEFSDFTFDVTGTGKIQYSAPNGLHDDIVISHCLALWGLQPVIITPDVPKLSIVAEHYRDKVRQRDPQWIQNDIEAV